MGGSRCGMSPCRVFESAPRVHGWFLPRRMLRILRVVCPACAWVVPTTQDHDGQQLRLPRVCMGGSAIRSVSATNRRSAPRVHGWFRRAGNIAQCERVCPACAWVVPPPMRYTRRRYGLPRVCMGGSTHELPTEAAFSSAPRVHGWFQQH